MAPGVTATDFERGPLKDFGQPITRIPVTTAETGNGERIEVEGTAVTITAVLLRRKPKEITLSEGTLLTSSAYIMTLTSTTLNKDDIVVYRGNRFRVLAPIERYSPTNIPIYKYADLIEIGTE